MSVQKTKAIILRGVRYGETSLIVSAFTELFGVQSYLVRGARGGKKPGLHVALYEPATVVELEAYRNPKSNLQGIREAGRAVMHQRIHSDVILNCISLFFCELLYKLLKQPEPNEELFAFSEDFLSRLENADHTSAANFPLFLLLHLSHFFGVRINDNFDEDHSYLDLREGGFTGSQPQHPQFISGDDALISSEILKAGTPEELSFLKLNGEIRRRLIFAYLDFYGLHFQDFGEMRSLSILTEILR